jgi:hypothetical protein
VAPTVALVGLAWILQACCCGVPYQPSSAPPGTIGGRLLFPPPSKSQALAVYAVDSYALDSNGSVRYAMTRVVPPATTYVLAVPPGAYWVLARLDSDPLSFAGYTFDLMCSRSPATCSGNSGNYTLVRVSVQTNQNVVGIDIGDWGRSVSEGILWNLDLHGSPLARSFRSPAAPKSLPFRPMPSAQAPDWSGQFVDTPAGARIPLPTGWHEIKPPSTVSPNSSEIYIASEAVSSPLSLDSNGVWLTVHWDIGRTCPSPDWSLATAQTRVSMGGTITRSGVQNGTEDFYFENPTGDVGVQPFTGYVMWGAGEHFATDFYAIGDCIEFAFTGVTQSGLESNLPAIAAVLQGTSFTSPH